MEWTERWSLEGNPDAKDDWASENGSLLTPAEWFAVEGRFARFFEVLPRASWGDKQIALDVFLAMMRDERDGLTPYVELEDSAGRPKRLRVADEMVEAAETIKSHWRLLQEMAGIRSTLLAVARKQVEAELREVMDAEHGRLKAESNARIEEVRAGYDQVFREKLAARLLALSGFGGASGTLADWLADMERQGSVIPSAARDPSSEGRPIHSEPADSQNSGG